MAHRACRSRRQVEPSCLHPPSFLCLHGHVLSIWLLAGSVGVSARTERTSAPSPKICKIARAACVYSHWSRNSSKFAGNDSGVELTIWEFTGKTKSHHATCAATIHAAPTSVSPEAGRRLRTRIDRTTAVLNAPPSMDAPTGGPKIRYVPSIFVTLDHIAGA